MDTSATGAPRTRPWTCGACGYENDGGATCDRCGVARRWLEHPPLDLPPRPAFFERPAGWWSLAHGAATLFGALLLVRPEVAPWLALAAPAQAVQVALSLAAAVASLNRAATERLFHEVALEVPDRAPAGEELVADARLVPYGRTEGVHVTLELIENTYHRTRGRNGETRMATRSKRLGRHKMLSGETVPGRRASLLEATFIAPFPTQQMRDVMAELQASAMAALAWLVPGLGQAARNLREHGGVWVRLTVRVGPFFRRVEKRVVVYQMQGDWFAIG
jgi:hypothetical protein